ncbi:MAG: hypothetical protein AAGJ54_07100 [Planctomycetota bacterium]
MSEQAVSDDELKRIHVLFMEYARTRRLPALRKLEAALDPFGEQCKQLVTNLADIVSEQASGSNTDLSGTGDLEQLATKSLGNLKISNSTIIMNSPGASSAPSEGSLSLARETTSSLAASAPKSDQNRREVIVRQCVIAAITGMVIVASFLFLPGWKAKLIAIGGMSFGATPVLFKILKWHRIVAAGMLTSVGLLQFWAEFQTSTKTESSESAGLIRFSSASDIVSVALIAAGLGIYFIGEWSLQHSRSIRPNTGN